MWEYLSRAPTQYTTSPNLTRTVTYININNVGFTDSHGTHVNYYTSDRLTEPKTKIPRTHTKHKTKWPSVSIRSTYSKQQNNNHEYGPINTTSSLQNQINNSSLLSPPEQLHIKSHYYHKELTPEKNRWKQPHVPLDLRTPHYVTISNIHQSILRHYQLPRTQYQTHSSTYKTAYTDSTYNLPSYHILRHCIALLETLKVIFYGFIRLFYIMF